MDQFIIVMSEGCIFDFRYFDVKKLIFGSVQEEGRKIVSYLFMSFNVQADNTVNW